MATNFKFNNGGNTADFSDAFIPRDAFSQGGLWRWGANPNGEIGDNTIDKKSSPVQTISGGTNWKQVSVGNHVVSAIKTDGTLWIWGSNYIGELGDNTLAHKSSPVQTVAGGTNWKQVSCGLGGTSNVHVAAIKTDGTLWTWGANASNALGDGGNIPKSSAVQTIAGGTNW